MKVGHIIDVPSGTYARCFTPLCSKSYSVKGAPTSADVMAYRLRANGWRYRAGFWFCPAHA